MGVSICGFKPKCEAGKYFDANWWAWSSIAAYVQSAAPKITKKCKHWDMNEGDGLDDKDAKALADVVQWKLDSGQAAALLRRNKRALRTLGGSLKTKQPNIQIILHNIQAFVAFLRNCGGFAIY